MQTFTDDFPLNSVQNLPVITSESEEKFDFSPSTVAAGVKICNKLDILKKYHILGVIHSIFLIYIFHQIPLHFRK